VHDDANALGVDGHGEAQQHRRQEPRVVEHGDRGHMTRVRNTAWRRKGVDDVHLEQPGGADAGDAVPEPPPVPAVEHGVLCNAVAGVSDDRIRAQFDRVTLLDLKLGCGPRQRSPVAARTETASSSVSGSMPCSSC
ncbi:MAG: hypothetical protein ACTHZ9_13025, partial [Leucobacter sp.]